ncbi:MAG: hypothetical protein ACHQNA_05055 [Acidimicrobiales bacterium]
MTGEGEVQTRQGICENCARDDGDLVSVHRVYIVPEAWDTPGSSTVMAEAEWWCFSCRSMYPHQLQAGSTPDV